MPIPSSFTSALESLQRRSWNRLATKPGGRKVIQEALKNTTAPVKKHPTPENGPDVFYGSGVPKEKELLTENSHYHHVVVRDETTGEVRISSARQPQDFARDNAYINCVNAGDKWQGEWRGMRGLNDLLGSKGTAKKKLHVWTSRNERTPKNNQKEPWWDGVQKALQHAKTLETLERSVRECKAALKQTQTELDSTMSALHDNETAMVSLSAARQIYHDETAELEAAKEEMTASELRDNRSYLEDKYKPSNSKYEQAKLKKVELEKRKLELEQKIETETATLESLDEQESKLKATKTLAWHIKDAIERGDSAKLEYLSRTADEYFDLNTVFNIRNQAQLRAQRQADLLHAAQERNRHRQVAKEHGLSSYIADGQRDERRAEKCRTNPKYFGPNNTEYYLKKSEQGQQPFVSDAYNTIRQS